MKEGIIVFVKIAANAPKNSIAGWEEDYLKIKIRAIPERGKANAALIDFLSELFSIRKSSITILSGHTSPLKKLQILGLSEKEFLSKI